MYWYYVADSFTNRVFIDVYKKTLTVWIKVKYYKGKIVTYLLFCEN